MSSQTAVYQKENLETTSEYTSGVHIWSTQLEYTTGVHNCSTHNEVFTACWEVVNDVVVLFLQRLLQWKFSRGAEPSPEVTRSASSARRPAPPPHISSGATLTCSSETAPGKNAPKKTFNTRSRDQSEGHWFKTRPCPVINVFFVVR